MMQRVKAALLPVLPVIRMGEQVPATLLLMAKVSILPNKYGSSSFSNAADYCVVSLASVRGRFLQASFSFGGTPAENM